MALSKPARSACWTSARSWRGLICSCEAWKPIRVTARYLHEAARGVLDEVPELPEEG